MLPGLLSALSYPRSAADSSQRAQGRPVPLGPESDPADLFAAYHAGQARMAERREARRVAREAEAKLRSRSASPDAASIWPHGSPSWECSAFPSGPKQAMVREAWKLFPQEHPLTERQRCEAGNRWGNPNGTNATYLFNRGRNGSSPGLCGVGDCWCCARRQTPEVLLSFDRPQCSYNASFNTSNYTAEWATARREIREALEVPDGYPSCAIVGSSGRLLHSTHGPAIDDHALVVRMNTAPTVGFEPQAGTRTTVRLMATTGLDTLLSEHCGDNASAIWGDSCDGGSSWCPASDVILNSFLTDLGLDVDYSPETRRFKGSCGGMGQRIVSMTETQRTLVNRTLTPPGKHFMSGLAGVALLAMLCDRGVDLYGFDDGTQPEDTAYHYYDDAVANVTLDDFAVSQQLLSDMAVAEAGCIRIHREDDAD